MRDAIPVAKRVGVALWWLGDGGVLQVNKTILWLTKILVLVFPYR